MQIYIGVENKVAQLVDLKQYIVCGNSDYTINFLFDDEWNDHVAKTARFEWGSNSVEVPFTGTQCPCPVITDTIVVKIGVFAGDLDATTPAYVMCRKSILCGSGGHDDPSLDVYNQLMGLLDEMQTGGASPEDIENAIAAYFEENPVEVPEVDLSGYATTKQLDEVSEAIAELQKGGSLVEPAVNDIPKVFFKGIAPTTKAEDELPLEMEYVSKSLRFHDYVTLKVQGDSSAGYPKKNFNLKMFTDADRSEKDKRVFRDWSKTHKYCLKANWIDHTHARNVVNGRLWGQVVRTRADYESYPEDYRESANCGAVNGFPVKVYINGIYQGLYTWNIRKDESMFNMDDETGTHAALIADGVNAITAWRELPTIGGGDWTDELNDVVPEAVKASFQNAYTFVMQSTDEEFRANIEQHFYLSSLIDYYIFIYSILMYGGLAKSQTMLTYDADKYLANIYDMDTTWALYWNGKSFISVTTACPEGYEHTAGYNLLYERLVKNFATEIKARYAELRSTVLSDANIINEFERFMDVVPPDLYAEDFASTTAGGKFTEIPSADTNNLQKLRDIIVNRMAYCDEQIPLIDAVEEEIPATGITLSASALTFTDSTSQTLTATVEPSDTTDTVVWNSDNNVVATVTNGVVKPISNGSCDITATAGSVSATCTVTVDVEELVVLTGISATYTGGDVTAGTALTDLTGITVTATYSDGSTEAVTDYTLSGSISVGVNTITVTYEGLTTTFTVNGTEMDYGDALYPLVNGNYTSSTGMFTVDVTNGNHVKISNLSGANATMFVNMLDIVNNAPTASAEAVNNKSEKFTLNSGDSVVYSITGTFPLGSSFGWRVSNSATAIAELAKSSMNESFTDEVTLSADYSVGSMFIYGAFKAGYTYEFDVSLIVNNQRYI